MTGLNPLRIAAIVAVIFGVMTLVTGGKALFGSAETQALFGAVVGFVLWFNFLAGFGYVAAGAGLWFGRPWAAWLAAAIATATLLVFAAFGVHVALGGAFEARTVGALALRSLVWLAIAGLACRRLGCRRATRAA